jgi:hypothetical protein
MNQASTNMKNLETGSGTSLDGKGNPASARRISSWKETGEIFSFGREAEL